MAKKNEPELNEEPETAPAAGPDYVVTITAPSHRRRAGFAFGPVPTHLTAGQLDDEKVAALKADPLLSIRPYEPEPEAGA